MVSLLLFSLRGVAIPSPAEYHGRSPAPKPTGVLLDVVAFIQRYMVLPSQHAVVAIALWVGHTWVIDAFDTTPYLLVRSPEKRSGKTRLLEILELLTPRPWHVVQPSEAVLFRKISKDHPTLLLDEADTIFNGRGEQYEPLRALLNAGVRRGIVIPRCVGDGAKQQLVDFEVFCPKVVASIGCLPDTVEDRGISIRLDRATPDEQRRIHRLRFKEVQTEVGPLRKALEEWATQALPALRDARPAIPEELDGRAADAWEPLLAVADQGGGGWSVLAWGASLGLSTAEAREDESLRVRLLADIQCLFDDRGADRLATTDLIAGLCENESAPWGDWHGRPITPQALARLVRPFGIRPSTIRTGSVTAKGYYRADFEGAWQRYLSPSLSNGSVAVTTSQSLMDAGFGAISAPSRTAYVTGTKEQRTLDLDGVVTGVTDKTPPGGIAGRIALPPFGDSDRRAVVLRMGEILGWPKFDFNGGTPIAAGEKNWGPSRRRRPARTSPSPCRLWKHLGGLVRWSPTLVATLKPGGRSKSGTRTERGARLNPTSIRSSRLFRAAAGHRPTRNCVLPITSNAG